MNINTLILRLLFKLIPQYITPHYLAILGYGGIWSSLSGLVGSKPLTRQNIDPVISKMQEHLMSKNVAADVAYKLCDSVTSKLEGKICGNDAYANQSSFLS